MTEILHVQVYDTRLIIRVKIFPMVHRLATIHPLEKTD